MLFYLKRNLINLIKKNDHIKGFTKSIISLMLLPISYITIARESRKKCIYLEIGSGAKKGSNGWITLDSGFQADIHWDLRNGIPFPDESLDKIYTSHTFEHIPFNDLKKVIQLCYKKLKKGGTLSVCVPNARNYIKSYIEGNRFIDLYDESKVSPSSRCDTGSLIDQVNLIAYLGGQHCYMFDQENLINILKASGFEFAKARGFEEGLDLKERDHESIYAIAIKE